MYAYEKLMNEHKLTINELPVDAQTGIKNIKKIEVAINMQDKKAEKAGKTYTPSPSVTADIKTFDKWVVREILDYVDDKDTNTAAPGVKADEIIADIKKDEPTKTDEPKKEADPKGLACDKEFAEMLKAGKVEVTLEELKSLAPTAEGLIWDDKDEVKGVSTTYYLLSQTTPNNFKLTKK